MNEFLLSSRNPRNKNHEHFTADYTNMRPGAKKHSCSPSSVWVSSHLECIVTGEMVTGTTYDQTFKSVRPSWPLFTAASFPGHSQFFFPSVYTPNVLFVLLLSRRCDGGCKTKRLEAESLQLLTHECEEMGFTGLNLALKDRLRGLTNKTKKIWSSLLS